MLDLDKTVLDNVTCMKPKRLAKCRRETNGAYLIYADKTYYHFNETAGFIYEHCDGKNTIADILNIMKKEYSDFVESLLLKDLIFEIRAMVHLGLAVLIPQE